MGDKVNTERREKALVFSHKIKITRDYESRVINKFYQAVPVLNASDEEKKVRLALVQKTATILKIGLGLLGIEAPERM